MCGAVISLFRPSPSRGSIYRERPYTPPDYQQEDYVSLALCYSRSSVTSNDVGKFYQELLDGLEQEGLVQKGVRNNFYRIKFCEACPFVCHACAQVCTFDCPGVPLFDYHIQRINKKLSGSKIIGFVRLKSNNFNAKTCEHECVFDYVMPKMFLHFHLPESIEKNILSLFSWTKELHNYGSPVARIRNITFLWDDDDFVAIQFRGANIASGVVESVVGVLVSYCFGRMTIPDILVTFARTKKLNLPIAPSSALILTKVIYTDNWTVNGNEVLDVNFHKCRAAARQENRKLYDKIKRIWLTDEECIQFRRRVMAF